MKIKLLSLVLVSGIMASSCKKTEKFEQVDNKSLNDISAPASFLWSGSRDVRLSLGITDGSFGTAIHVVKVYSADPAKGGELLSTGSATLITPFNTKFTLSSMIKQVYIEKISPSGAVMGQTLDLVSDDISAAIGANGLSQVASAKNSGLYSINKSVSVITNEATPTVPAGAIVVPNGANNYQMTAGSNYVISANNASVNFADPQGGTLYITGNGVNLSQFKMLNNNTVIITGTGTTFASNFSWDNAGSTMKIFGSLTTNNFKIGGSFRNQGTLTVNGVFTVSQNTTNVNSGAITVNGNTDINAPFENGGTMTLTGANEFKAGSNFTNNGGATLAFGNSGASIRGTLNNAGTVTFAGGEINLNSSTPTVLNSGTFTATNSRMNLTGNFTNNGSVTVKTLEYNSGGLIINNCKWLVTENATAFDGPLRNYSYFRVTGSSNINNNGVITLYNGAKFRTGSLQAMNAVAVGDATGTKSVFKVDGSLDGNMINNARNDNNGGQARFSGNLQVELSTSMYPVTATQPGSNSSDLPYVNGLPVGFLKGGAQRLISSNAVYIPVTDCMVEGSGTAPVNNDTDGDGVINSQDAFPNDATKAYIIESENYINGGSTVAFEDNWPKKGDYDLNDIVINYKYQVITNAQNKVVRVQASYKLLATGGEFHNGAGIEFPLIAAKATNFSGPTGTSLEGGQAKVVVILFTDSRVEQATWNTQTTQATSAPVIYNIAFDVIDGPAQSDFGFNFNPFIWNNGVGYGRGYETHLFGKTPTSKANTALFGTGDDATNQTTRYYGTATNLPWAITLPISTFKYPLERVPITDGYKKFSNWATNAGSLDADWYIGTTSAYRDAAKLY